MNISAIKYNSIPTVFIREYPVYFMFPIVKGWVATENECSDIFMYLKPENKKKS